jgi:Family of unknown function (DUF5681)
VDKPAADRKGDRAVPPRSTRFTLGKSGNPNGRPKVDKDDPASAFRLVMGKTILITEKNGKQRKVSSIEAVFMRVLRDALNGKPQAIKQLLELVRQLPSPPGLRSDRTTEQWNEFLAGFDTTQLKTIREFSVKNQAFREQKRKGAV